MNRFSSSIFSLFFSKTIFFSFFFFLFLIAVYFLNSGKLLIPILLLSIPFLLILIENLNKNFLYYLIATLCIEFYFYVPLKIQVINVVVYVIFIFFLMNKNSSLFNNYRLPNSLKFASGLFIFAVFISSINTIHQSFQSVYYSYLLVTYLFTGYIVFRSIKNNFQLERVFNFYFFCIAISSAIVLIEAIFTSQLRTRAVIGYPIMDFSAITLTMLLIKYFVGVKKNLKIFIITLLVFTVLIISLSRFAWLGFFLSSIYGLILILKYDTEGKQFFKKKLTKIILFILIFIGISISLGIQKIIFARFSDISFEFFVPNEEGLIQNSLETRALIWLTAYKAFESNPVTGIGYQMFNFVSENYNVFPSGVYEEFIEELDPHSTMLAFLAETGILGLCSFLIFIITIYCLSFKSIKISTNRVDRINSIVLNVIVFFIFVNSIHSGQYTIGQQAFFMYIFFGLSVGNYVFLSSMWQNRIKLEKKL